MCSLQWSRNTPYSCWSKEGITPRNKRETKYVSEKTTISIRKTNLHQDNEGRLCNNSEIDTIVSKRWSLENKAKLSATTFLTNLNVIHYGQQIWKFFDQCLSKNIIKRIFWKAGNLSNWSKQCYNLLFNRGFFLAAVYSWWWKGLLFFKSTMY